MPGVTGDPDRWTIHGESETSPSHENVPRSPVSGPSAPPTRIALGGSGESGGRESAGEAVGSPAGEVAASEDDVADGASAALAALARPWPGGAGVAAGPAQPAMTNTRAVSHAT